MTARTDQEPILASWKISEVLQKHPQLLDTLVELSPAFSKLRNPLMRKVQTRLVTVAQAAEIAGIAPAELTRTLNQAVGISPVDQPEQGRSEATPSPSTERPAWADTAPVVEELDVRPAMLRGEEPFHAIMQTARRVPAGSAFRLLVGFEPLPLYDALARQGFTHATAQLADTWQVLFYREPGAESSTAQPDASEPAAGDLDWDAPATAEVSIDVSELVPPEPMIKILQTLETLPPDGRLLVHHVRRPMHLYGRLDDMGYAHATRDISPGHVEVLIQKRSGRAPS